MRRERVRSHLCLARWENLIRSRRWWTAMKKQALRFSSLDTLQACQKANWRDRTLLIESTPNLSHPQLVKWSPPYRLERKKSIWKGGRPGRQSCRGLAGCVASSSSGTGMAQPLHWRLPPPHEPIRSPPYRHASTSQTSPIRCAPASFRLVSSRDDRTLGRPCVQITRTRHSTRSDTVMRNLKPSYGVSAKMHPLLKPPWGGGGGRPCRSILGKVVSLLRLTQQETTYRGVLFA